ncbi:hypothetical protein IT413_05085 [Candidatus Peregrinibacteria bacterium]|nr:hypothetical protein [Candidatus Peregrinibacteria bacterium]
MDKLSIPHLEAKVLKSRFAKNIGVAALLAITTTTAAAALGCSGEEFTSGDGSGGAAGSENAGGKSGASGTGGKENVGGSGGMAGKENAGGQGGVSGIGGKLNTGGDAGFGGGGAAGCLDVSVKIKSTTGQYEVKQYDQDCAVDGVNTLDSSFETGEQDLCVKPGGGFVVQIKNAANKNAIEFFASEKPVTVRSVGFGVTTPISNAEADAYCNSSTGDSLNPTTADKDPAADNYKYVPVTQTQTNGFIVKY